MNCSRIQNALQRSSGLSGRCGAASAARLFAAAIVLAGVLGIAGCVGLAGKPGFSGNLSASPSSIDFGAVNVNSSNSQSIQLTNTGQNSVKITSAGVSGSAFSMSGLTLPLTLTAGTDATFDVAFKPSTPGSESGTISIMTDSSPLPLVISLSGTTGSGNSSLKVTPEPVAFGAVTVGTTNSQTLRLSNNGSSDAQISAVTTTGAGFRVGSITAPLTLHSGESATFTAFFKPSASGNASGSISIASNAAGSPLVVGLSGMGESAMAQLKAAPGSVNFGNVTVGTKHREEVTLLNTGNVALEISSVSVSGAGFSASGGSKVSLTPGQSIKVNIDFEAKKSGNARGALFVSSKALHSALQVGLLADAEPSGRKHSVLLTWDASTSAVVGYQVYRGTVSRGPYARLSSNVDRANSFKDSTIQSGRTYFYVVTSVASDHKESSFSRQVSVTVP